MFFHSFSLPTRFLILRLFDLNTVSFGDFQQDHSKDWHHTLSNATSVPDIIIILINLPPFDYEIQPDLLYETQKAWLLLFRNNQAHPTSSIDPYKAIPVYQYKKTPWNFCSMGFGGPEETRTLDLSDANRTLSQLSYRPLSLVILSQQISPVNSFLSGKGASRFQDAPFSFTLRQDRSKLQFQSRRYEHEPRPPRHIGRSCRHRDVRYTVRSWQPQLRMQAAR